MKVIVLSGGMDSTVLLYEMVKNFGAENVKALNFSYGSKHNKEELKRAIRNCSKLKVPLNTVELDLSDIFKSNFFKSGGDIPEGHYASANMVKTVVPFRNGIMLAIATGYAESVGAEEIYIGNHAGDHDVYPDCRGTFIEAFREAMAYGTYKNIKLASPYCTITKADIVRKGKNLGIDFRETYSCYKGQDRQCGRCSTCFERREAFYIANVVNPTYYYDKTPIEKLIKEYEI